MDLFDLAERNREARVQKPARMPDIRNVEAKRRTVLERLLSGPLSTFDAERLVHRGQAVIGALRSEGHVIDLTQIGNVDHYVYRRFIKLIKVTADVRDAYYRTAHWRALSSERRVYDRDRCCQCGADQKLEVHHWRYDLFNEIVRLDLMALCCACHQAVHSAASGSSIHFPRFLEEQIIVRIEVGG